MKPNLPSVSTTVYATRMSSIEKLARHLASASLLVAIGACAHVNVPVSSVKAPTDLVYRDDAHGISIRYDFQGPNVVFSGTLPKDWGFEVNVDGDQNGIWGLGPADISPTRGIRPGRQGADPRYSGFREETTVFEAQYIFEAFPTKPESVYSVSAGGLYPSKGYGTVTRPNKKHYGISMFVPVQEMFGSDETAHIQVCIWSTRAATCQGAPRDPIIIRRPVAPGAG